MNINTNTSEAIDFTASELQKIQTYIKNTGRPESVRYDIPVHQFKLLGDLAYSGDVFNALNLAIQYGKAKGYRQGKAEQKAKRQ